MHCVRDFHGIFASRLNHKIQIGLIVVLYARTNSKKGEATNFANFHILQEEIGFIAPETTRLDQRLNHRYICFPHRY